MIYQKHMDFTENLDQKKLDSRLKFYDKGDIDYINVSICFI